MNRNLDAKSVFYDWLDQPQTVRHEFLTKVCGDNTLLRKEVEELIQCHEDPDTFLDEPVVHFKSESKADQDTDNSFAKPSQQTQQIPVKDSQSEAKCESDYPTISGYEVLDVLGRGGMGLVYLARQTKANRLVALKVMLPQHQENEEERRRFQTEAEAIAQIQHPNIVQIYEVGEQEECAFFSLEFCPAGSLDRYLSGTVLSHRQVASVIRDMASAVHAAHDVNILHRDLKPGNVLLTPKSTSDWENAPFESLTIKVTDFGTAKKMDVEPNTLTGMIIGTPAYLSPEQAQAQALGPTSDVFALGAVLYELLTGRPPFRGVTTFDTICQIVQNDPVPPRQLSPEIPIDLETICLKCLEKNPNRRYETAKEVEQDLERYLQGEPIQARPISSVERAVKWVKRRPAVSSLLFALLVAILGGVGFATWFALKSQANAYQALLNAQQATEAANRASEKEQEARREWARAEKERKKAADFAYSKQFSFAALQAESGNWLKAQLALDELPAELHGWEYNYLRHQLHREPAMVGHSEKFNNKVISLAFSPDGKLLASGDELGVVKIWSLESFREIQTLQAGIAFVRGIAFSPDNRLLATCVDTAGFNKCTISLWKASTWEKTISIGPLETHKGGIAFSPDGKVLARGDRPGRVALWDPTNGKLIQTLEGTKGTVKHFAFDSNSTQLATLSDEAQLTLWDLAKGEQAKLKIRRSIENAPIDFDTHGNLLFWSKGFNSRILPLQIEKNVPVGRPILGSRFANYASSTDLKFFAVGEEAGIRIYDTKSGKLLRTISNLRTAPSLMAFSPDSQWLASVYQNKIRLWQATKQSGYHVGNHRTQRYSQLHLTHPHLPYVVSSKQGANELVLWEPDSQKKEALKGHSAAITAKAISGGGKYVVTGHQDGTVQLWNLELRKATRTVKGNQSAIHQVVVSPNGRFVATLDKKGLLSIWDITKQQTIHSSQGSRRSIVAADPKQPRFLYSKLKKGNKQYRVFLFDCSDSSIQEFKHPKGNTRKLTFDPLGKRFAISAVNGVKIYSLSDQQVTNLHGQYVNPTFSPDGKYYAGIRNGNEIHCIRCEDGESWVMAAGNNSNYRALYFFPDGKRLFSVESDGRCLLWDYLNSELQLALPGPSLTTNPTKFTIGLLNNKSLFMTSEDGKYVTWTAGDGFQYHRLLPSTSHLSAMAIRPDSKVIATVEWGRGKVSCWDARTKKRLWHIRKAIGWGQEIAFSPDNRHLAIACKTKIELHDSETGALIRSIDLNKPIAKCLVFSPNGQQIFVGHRNGEVTGWQLSSGKLMFQQQGDPRNVSKIVCSGDGTRVAAVFDSGRQAHQGGYLGVSVVVWDIRAQQQIIHHHSKANHIYDFDLNKDGTELVLALGGIQNTGKSVVQFWNIDQGELKNTFQPQRERVWSVDLSPDDKKLLTSGSDLTARIWNVATLKQEFVFSGHENNVIDAVFDAKGEWVLTRSHDWTCNLFKPLGRSQWIHPLGEPIRRKRDVRR